MSGEPLRDLLAFAVETALAAGRVTLPYFREGVEREVKADGSPVTAADRAAESVVRARIAERFPDDGLLGEELGAERQTSPRCWVVDPIDGTRSFVRGVPLYGTLLALVDGGDPVLGVIHLPALDETVAAARGEGCWWNGSPARVSTIDRLNQALVLSSDSEGARRARGAEWERIAAVAGMSRTWGDCYGYALVATGRAEVMLDPALHPWDMAALPPILTEAGGVFSGWDGESAYPTRSGLATNAALAAEVRTLLRGAP